MKSGKRFGKVIATILTAMLACFLLPQANASYMVEGTPTQKAVSDTVETKEPVCYIGSTFYTSIEGALTAAGSNSTADTVYVIPGVTTTISKDCTIASGDSLILPYSATLDESSNTYSGETYTNGNAEDGTENTSWVDEGTSGFADSSSDNVKSNRVCLVTLAEEKTLTVNGNLYIGGQSGRNGIGVIDQTNGKYCEIFMENDTTINVTSGAKLVNYGYIKKRTYKYNESGTWSIVGSLDNTCTINVNGTMKTPLVIYDYKGGNNTLTMIAQEVCPFEIFDFPNLQVPVKYYAGCKLLGNIRIYASVSSIDAKYETDIAVIGSSADSPAFIVESGYVEFDYQVTSSKNPVTSYTTNTKGTNDLTAVTIVGTASLNYIYFNIEDDFGTAASFILNLLSLSGEVDTRELTLPFSYKYDFEVTASSTMNILYPVKFMPGCNAVVDEGATLNVTGNGSLLLYGSDFTESSSIAASYAYPTGLDEAKLTCNGTFNLTGSFGGTLLTESENAIFNATNGTLSASCLDGYANTSTSNFSITKDLTTVEKTALGYIVDADGNTTTSITNFDNNFYAGTSNPTGYWYVTDPVNITWTVNSVSNAVDGIAFSVNGMTVTYVNGTSSEASVQVKKGATVNLDNVRGVSSFSVGGSSTTSFTANSDTTFTITPMTATATLTVNYVYANATSGFSVVISNGKSSVTVASLSLSSNGTYTYNCLDGETYSITDTSYVKSVSPSETGSISSSGTTVTVYGLRAYTLTVNHEGETFGIFSAYKVYPNYYLTYYKDGSKTEDTVYESRSTSTYTVDEGTTISITGFMTNTSGASGSYKRSYYITGLSTTAGSDSSSTNTTFTYDGTDYTAITLTFTMTADATVSFSYSY